MSKPIFETNRCIALPFAEADFEFLCQLHTHPEVMHFVGKGVRSEEEVRAQFANVLKHQERHGHSAWLIRHKETGNFLGAAGLYYLGAITGAELADTEDLPIELGYLLLPEYWGKGYGSELAIGCLKWGFTHLPTQEFVAKTSVHNMSSQKILEKAGMSLQKSITIEGMAGQYYTVSRAFFQQMMESPTIS